MPKQTLNINKFDGGMNTESDPRDIAENQLALLSGCYVDKRGIIRTSSSSSAEGLTPQELSDTDYLEGSGFYSFGADYEWDGTQNSDAYFHVINAGEHFYVYDGADSAWESQAKENQWLDDADTLILNQAAQSYTDTDPIYYFANNALRISDGNFSNTHNRTMWLGLINRTLMGGEVKNNTASLGYYTTPDNSDIAQSGAYLEQQFITSPLVGADTSDYISGNQPRNVWRLTDTANHNDPDHADNWDNIGYGGSVGILVRESGNSDLISESLKTKWFFGISYIYDGIEGNGCDGQESNIQVMMGATGNYYDDYANVAQVDMSSFENPAVVRLYWQRNGVDTSDHYWNSRVTGMRVYISEKTVGGGTFAAQTAGSTGVNWLRIADVDMIKGVWSQYCQGTFAFEKNPIYAIGDTADTNGGADTSATSAHKFVTMGLPVSDLTAAPSNDAAGGIFLAELPSESYYSLNGYKPDSLIDVKYKTATVLNRSTYIGNIYDVTNSQTYGDRIMKTPQGKYDTFSTNFFTDVVPGDGDSIIKLESFGDRLFVFKERTLYIVNVSQGDEFIEGEYQGMGIDKRRHAIKSEFGIIWINQNGVFHFDGSKINNLSDALIKSDWEAFFSTDASIGYDLKSKHLIIDCDIDNGTTDFTFNAFGLSSGDSNDGHALVYDFKIKAWTFLNGYFATGENRSNMVISSKDQKLMWYQQSETEAVKTYNDTSAAQTIAIHTKDFDFGNPAVRKKIYKVYVSYKGDASAVTCTYAINGDTDTVANFYKSGADGTTTGATDSTTPFHSSGVGVDDWVRAELKPVASINNIFSFALQFGGTAQADFQINDITIVYRGKNIK